MSRENWPIGQPIGQSVDLFTKSNPLANRLTRWPRTPICWPTDRVGYNRTESIDSGACTCTYVNISIIIIFILKLPPAMPAQEEKRREEKRRGREEKRREDKR